MDYWVLVLRLEGNGGLILLCPPGCLIHLFRCVPFDSRGLGLVLFLVCRAVRGGGHDARVVQVRVAQGEHLDFLIPWSCAGIRIEWVREKSRHGSSSFLNNHPPPAKCLRKCCTQLYYAKVSTFDGTCLWLVSRLVFVSMLILASLCMLNYLWFSLIFAWMLIIQLISASPLCSIYF